MHIRVDYHFHPNLPLSLPFFMKFFCKRKVEKIWQAFKKYNLTAVIVAEHSYKNPKTSFEILKKFKPPDACTKIFPGIEVLSKEGIDMIAFSENESVVYSKKELLTPWALNINQIIALIDNNDGLFGIVVHPHTPGTTSIYRRAGREVTHEAIKKLGLLEKHNCSFVTGLKIFRILGLKWIFKKKYQQMVDTDNAPDELAKNKTITTVGSDAHHTGEIGDYAEIKEPPDYSEKDIFDIITSKSGELHKNENKSFLSFLINMLFTVPLEFFIKKLHLYKIDKPL